MQSAVFIPVRAHKPVTSAVAGRIRKPVHRHGNESCAEIKTAGRMYQTVSLEKIQAGFSKRPPALRLGRIYSYPLSGPADSYGNAVLDI